MDLENQRFDGRQLEEMRPVHFQPGIAPHAAGSVLVSFGNTQVICAATLEPKVPRWMIEQKVQGGWLTAEYSMLPYSTLDRKERDGTRGKVDGRTIEIQRLIGRALRSVCDLSRLPGHTLWIDCDVLQADGGTRTASITGAYVAARMAIAKYVHEGRLPEIPFSDSVAAISVGVWNQKRVLDLNYYEDKDAAVDANIVMTGKGRFVELQASGEESTFGDDDLTGMIKLAKKGVMELTLAQNILLKQVGAL
ncbi:MAG: ribonuclease PH [Verrucomicrobiota bacterium]|nr:ribonuclease PH [Verrucomicrobiota bacterium]